MRRTVLAVNIVLLLLIAWSVAGYGWAWWKKSHAPAAVTAPAAPVIAPVPQVDLAALHLFGESSVEVGPEAAANAPETPPGQSLLGVADQSAKSGNLGPAMKRIEPEGQHSARVWLEQAAFDDLMLWLQGLKRDYGIHAADIVIERQEAAGRVNARITLESG